MLMVPAQAQLAVQVLLKAASIPMVTVGEPGDQGATMTGTQGMGVSTPCAAAVAADTVGLASDVQLPKGMMLDMGTKSMIVPAGLLQAFTLFIGIMVSWLGARPKEHCKVAPIHTNCAIEPLRLSY